MILSLLGINPHWILDYRSELLTAIFKIFPFFASDFFYITVIAMGYWLRPRHLIFAHLGFLVAASTLLNCILKNIFRISRPDSALHLVPLSDSFGFPSGDIQVASVFWFMVFLNLKRVASLSYLCWAPILGIFISRVYLGVHSIYDVSFGLMMGLATVYFWHRPSVQHCIVGWYKGCSYSFWITAVLLILACGLMSYDSQWLPMASMAMGALLGYGISLYAIGKNTHLMEQGYSIRKFIGILLSLALVVAVVKFLRIEKVDGTFYNAMIIVKYTFILFFIYTIVPELINKFSKTR